MLEKQNTWSSILTKGFIKRSDPPISLSHNQIKRVKVTKSLGLMIDETLTWHDQVTLITKKVNKGLNVMR